MTDYNQMRNAVSGKASGVALWLSICNEAEQKEKSWIEDLRARGFKAAHPNDGWVDRENNTLHFAYPQFNDGAGVGDLVMLGWPSDGIEKLRPVRLTGTTGTMVERFAFEDKKQI